MFRKFATILRLKAARSLQYRSEISIWLILDSLPFILLFFVWKSLFSDVSTLNNYSFADLIEYYLLVFLITSIGDTHFAEWRVNQVKNGEIDHYLSKPFSFINEIFWSELAGKLVYTLIFIPTFLIVLWVCSQLFSVELQTLSPVESLYLLFFLAITFSINFMISTWIVLSAFWLESAHGLTHFHALAGTILSGAMIPVTFMPPWMSSVVLALPLKYLYLVPIGVMQGTYTFTWNDGIYLGTTLAFMLFGTFHLWQQALYKYSSGGG